MKGETLFRALGEVGDDLLHMAEHRRFRSPWRRWAPLAACLMLVVSFSILALPYFPMGCGSGSAPENDAAMDIPAAAPESMVQDTEKAESAPAEAPAEEAPAEAPMPEEESDAPQEKGEAGTTWVVYGSTYYYVLEEIDGFPADKEPAVTGFVTDSNDAAMIGGSVCAMPYTTWFTNHAVDGLAVPQAAYLHAGQRWYYMVTCNEKTVARYTASDVQTAIDTGDDQFLLETFVYPWERNQVGGLLPELPMESQQLNRLFLASLQMNTGIAVEQPWLQDDGALCVPPSDVVWRLERFLDTVDYDPAATDEFDPATGLVCFHDAPAPETVTRTLEKATLEDNVLRLWVGGYAPEGAVIESHMLYEIRLDADSWRYVSAMSCG